MIFNRSSGLTTVREAAPATPPAMKYEETCGLMNVPKGNLLRCFAFSGAALDAAAMAGTALFEGATAGWRVSSDDSDEFGC